MSRQSSFYNYFQEYQCQNCQGSLQNGITESTSFTCSPCMLKEAQMQKSEILEDMLEDATILRNEKIGYLNSELSPRRMGGHFLDVNKSETSIPTPESITGEKGEDATRSLARLLNQSQKLKIEEIRRAKPKNSSGLKNIKKRKVQKFRQPHKPNRWQTILRLSDGVYHSFCQLLSAGSP